MICHREAPSAARSAISRLLAWARLSIMLATLAQAISTTKPTAPSIRRKMSRIGPPLNASWKVCTTADRSLFVAGNSCAIRVEITAMSLCAEDRLIPGERSP